MNFTGKWYTRNRTLVEVEPFIPGIDGQEWLVWRGKEVVVKPSHPPFEYDPVKDIYWNENGECKMVIGGFGKVEDFDLMERVNPQGVW